MCERGPSGRPVEGEIPTRSAAQPWAAGERKVEGRQGAVVERRNGSQGQGIDRGRRVAVVEGQKSRREGRSSPEDDDGRRGGREPQDLHTRRCKPQRSEHVRRKRKWRTEKGEERREGSEGREK